MFSRRIPTKLAIAFALLMVASACGTAEVSSDQFQLLVEVPDAQADAGDAGAPGGDFAEGMDSNGETGAVEADDSVAVATVTAAEEPPAEVDPTEAISAEADPAAVGESAAAAPEGPSEDEPWSSDYEAGIEPILENSCAQCHAPGAAGSQHFDLAIASDAANGAQLIAAYVSSREMPPWPATDLSVPFHNELALTDNQVQAVIDWAQGGAVLDVDPTTPIVSTVPVATLTDPEIEMVSEYGAYTGDPAVVDDYRCLIFDPKVTEPSWIVGTEFVPDQTQIVHHGIITLASKELRGQAEFWNGADGQPGWPCYSRTGLHTNDGGYQFGIAGWAPGGNVSRRPDGYGTLIQPGDFVIVQVHYHYDGYAPADLSQFRLDLADDSYLESHGGSLKNLGATTYLTPAELPCYEGDTHPLCDRDAAVARATELYGPVMGEIANALLASCGQTPADYADMTDGTSVSSCDKKVRRAGVIHSITPHMHELGLAYRMTLNPDTPEERILIDIEDWSFDWQFGYQPIEDIVVDRDDVVRIECTWNRERAPYEAVGWVIWADGTGDEMCYSSFVVRPT